VLEANEHFTDQFKSPLGRPKFNATKYGRIRVRCGMHIGARLGSPLPTLVCERQWAHGIFVQSRDPIFECILTKVGRNFVIVKYNQVFILSVYIAPSESDLDFNNA